MRRVVEPELLDGLPTADVRAVGSRADLRRLNRVMGHAGILARALRGQLTEAAFRLRPLRLVELGAGDGTLLLRVARRWSALGVTAEATLLDRQALVSGETRRAFAALNWSVESVATDVLTWLERTDCGADVMLANLFLHHFQERELQALLHRVAANTRLFVACEPRRGPLALTASRLLGLMGCNAVTRHDAAVSVRAGFAGRELSLLWPKGAGWNSRERSAGLFSHCFAVSRHG